MIRATTAMVAGMCMVCRTVGAPLDAWTYTRLFDRAKALVPARTTVCRNLAETGTWEAEGGRRVEQARGVTVVAAAKHVELVWRGSFPRELPKWRLDMTANIDVPVPVQISVDEKRYGTWRPVGRRTDVDAGMNRSISRKIGAAGLEALRLRVGGEGLAGRDVVIKSATLCGSLREGFFRRSVTIPRGAIWSAVAEIGNLTTLYVNGKRVDDETIILPRPANTGVYAYNSFSAEMYRSRRVPLDRYLKPGSNVIGLYTIRPEHSTAVYCRGSVIMASGERIMLDTDTNWVWSASASAGWAERGYDASSWTPVKHKAENDEDACTVPMSRWSLLYRPPGDMPCYDGFVRLRNPNDNKFYYGEKGPVAFDVSLPVGFLDMRPTLYWTLFRYSADKTLEQVRRGRISDLRTAGDSLRGRIVAEEAVPGVYVLKCRLAGNNGELIEDREPEALVVTGRVKMRKVAGDFLEQGMNMTLEKVIDFTDPDDPHPWFETDTKAPRPTGLTWGPKYYHTLDEPLIVQREGLTYRVTRPVQNAQFSYKVSFAHPGHWYLMVLEYPDDAERWIGVSCNASSRNMMALVDGRERPLSPSACSKCGPTIWTGGKYPTTGRMLKMKWIYRPDPGPHAINVMSLMKDTEAAVACLRIYHIEGRLPELDTGNITPDEQRRFGMLTERTWPWNNGVYNLFSSFALGDVYLSGRGNRGAGYTTDNTVIEACERLRLMQDAADHYAEYMRFAGQNLHTMGCYQYHDGNTASQYLTGDPRIHYNSCDMLARVLKANELAFYASVEFCGNTRSGVGRNRFRGRQTYPPDAFFVSRSGPVEVPDHPRPRGVNFFHPLVEADMLEVARQLAEAFRHQDNFLGINWTAFLGGAFLPSYQGYNRRDPLDLGYGDFTIDLFEADTGIDVPVDAGDPDRFEKRYNFLTSSSMKPRWLAWRSGKLAAFFKKVRGVIRDIRPDLETVAGCYVHAGAQFAEWKYSGLPFEQFLVQRGWDRDDFRDEPYLWLMPWLQLNARYKPAERAPGYAMVWQPNQDPDFYGGFSELKRRALMLCACWIEVTYVPGHFPYREGWPRPWQQTMMGQQREELALEPYTQGLLGMDPQMVMMGFTDVSPYIGVEHAQRKFARILRRLPWGGFKRVLDTGLRTNLAIRALRDGERYIFFVGNPGYWPITGSVTLTGAAAVSDLVSGARVATAGDAVPVALEPFGLAAYAVAGPEARVSAWRTQPVASSHIEHMRDLIEKARMRAGQSGMENFLGSSDYAILTNTVAGAEKHLAENRYAAAWSELTDAFFWTVLFQKAPESKFSDVGSRVIYACRAATVPEVDGVLDDEAWASSVGVTHFVEPDKQPDDKPTWVLATWTDDTLYVGFECTDSGNVQSDAEGSIGGKDDVLPRGGEGAVVVVKPGPGRCYELAVSPVEARSDGASERGVDHTPSWRSATAATKQGWTAELAIDAADAFGKVPEVGEQWEVNFYRTGRGSAAAGSWEWAPWEERQKRFGRIRFRRTNLMLNPSVERVKKGGPPGWSSYPGRDHFRFFVSAKEQHSGHRSAALTLLRHEKRPASAILASLPVKPDTTFDFSFWLKSEAPTVSVSVVPYNAAGKATGYIKTSVYGQEVRGPGWCLYEGAFTTDGTAVKARMGFSMGLNRRGKDGARLPVADGTTMYVDDLLVHAR